MIYIYKDFAYIYDKLMYDVDYLKWCDYIEKIFQKFIKKPSLVLDLGCGTGSVCTAFAQRGYEMIGVDSSFDMLACAKEKSLKSNVDVLYVNQDMCEFELYGTVDAVLCLMDSVNYVTDKNKLKRMLKLVSNYLNPDGLFIFDINTAFKLEKKIGSEVFFDVQDDITYIWQNSFDKSKRVCKFDLTFFVEKDNGLYERHDETHFERAYEIDELIMMINQSQLKVIGVYDDISFRAPNEESSRVFFVCEKQSDMKEVKQGR